MSIRPTHVIFDLDGTLLDSEPLYTIAAERVCTRYGATFTLELKRAIMGGDSVRGAQHVIDTLKLPLDTQAYLSERERELLELFITLAPIPHAPELVAALQARAVPMAIATSGHRHLTEAKLRHQPFLQTIQVRVCGDDTRLRRGKPAPDIFLLAAQDLGAPPERCVVVEDSILGTRAAKAAGMRSVALVDTRHGVNPEDFHEADLVVHSLADVSPERLGVGD